MQSAYADMNAVTVEEEKTTLGQDGELPVAPSELVRRWREEESPFPYPPGPASAPLEPLPDEASQAALRAACLHLDEGDPGRALEALATLDDRSSAIARSVEAVANGMIAMTNGDRESAMREFELAFSLGVPSPSVLAQCGRYFQSLGRVLLAYHCFSLLDQIRPGTLLSFLRELPARETPRFAPATVSKLLLVDRPAIVHAHAVKRGLVQRLGADGAAVVLGQLFGQAFPWHAVDVQLASLQEHAVALGSGYEELALPKPVEMAEPEVAGEAAGPPIAGHSRTVFFSILPDIIVPSKSSFLLAEGRALMDYQGDELVYSPLWFDLDPAVIAAEGRRLTVLRHTEAGRLPSLDEALSLVGMYSYNYAHFIVEKLFKVLACIGRPGFESVPILIDEQMQRAHREMLELFLGPGHPVVVVPAGASVQVSRLWTVSSPVFWCGWEVPGMWPLPYEELADVDFLAELLQRVEPTLQNLDVGEPTAQVLLSRKDYRLENRDEVEAWFRELGWLVVDPADLPFVEQLRVIRNARSVVVIDGAAKYGLFFGRAGLRVGLLFGSSNQGPPHDELHLFHEMLRRLGHRLLVLPGYPANVRDVWPGFSPFRVERDSLVAFLERLNAVGE